jgi:DNA-binding NtrC family response regulator
MARRRERSESRCVIVGGTARDPGRAEWLRQLANGSGETAMPEKLAVIYISAPTSYQDWSVANSLPWEGLPSDKRPRRILLLWDSLPVDALALVSWKDHLLGELSSDHTVLVCPRKASDLPTFKLWFLEQQKRWQARAADDEPVGLQLGEHIAIPADTEHGKVTATFASLAFGAMEQTIEQVQYWRRRYLEQIQHIGIRERVELHKSLAPILLRPLDGEEQDWERQQGSADKLCTSMRRLGFSAINPAALPILLLTGETGAGKTVIAKYLARLSMEEDRKLPFTRISVPEFEASEQHFEFELFGFRGGTYNDAPSGGDPGILLNHICGVVFLDEIGDASDITQRKLLAYLDDYQVRPRGLRHTFYCPTMVVAATNRPLEECIAAGTFRRDLYERFEHTIRVPSLNERKADFDFILDTLLQNPGVNPSHQIQSIGEGACRFLMDIDYSNGNFRRLERLLRFAIHEATREGRDKLLECDLAGWQDAQTGTTNALN